MRAVAYTSQRAAGRSKTIEWLFSFDAECPY